MVIAIIKIKGVIINPAITLLLLQVNVIVAKSHFKWFSDFMNYHLMHVHHQFSPISMLSPDLKI